MCKKIIVTILLSVFLFACTALKPIDKLTDQELIDRYYKTDLNLYMVKRAGKSNPTPANPGGYNNKGNSYSGGDTEKIKKIKGKLEIMRQELLKRGYIP